MASTRKEVISVVRSCFLDLREEFRLNRLKLEYPHPVHFVSGQWFRRSTVYIIWSGVWALYHFLMLMLDIHYKKGVGDIYLAQLTNWTYLQIVGVSISDFVITLYVHLKRKDIIDQSDPTLSTTWYMKIHWIFINIINTAAVMVTLLYFTVLEAKWTHSSVNKHLLIVFYTLPSLLFCAKPVRLLHVFHPFIYAFIYIISNRIYQAATGYPVYRAFDWDRPKKALKLSFLSLLVAVPLIHILCFALYKLRLFLFLKCFNNVSSDELKRKNLQREMKTSDIALHEMS